MFMGPDSFASAMVIMSSAPFVAEYREEFGTGFSLAIELMLIILPPLAAKNFNASWVARIGLRIFVSKLSMEFHLCEGL